MTVNPILLHCCLFLLLLFAFQTQQCLYIRNHVIYPCDGIRVSVYIRFLIVANLVPIFYQNHRYKAKKPPNLAKKPPNLAKNPRTWPRNSQNLAKKPSNLAKKPSNLAKKPPKPAQETQLTINLLYNLYHS